MFTTKLLMMKLYRITATSLILVASTVEPAKGNGDRLTQIRPSSNWWSRLIESSSIHDNPMPVNRRSHSATVYRFNSENKGADNINDDAREYMIVSGGFTDQDWQTFPVWAYDMTRARSMDDIRDEYKSESTTDGEIREVVEPFSERSPWMDLTGLKIGAAEAPDELNEFETGVQNRTAVGPQGRVGHLSSIHNDCLYIFGGLTYSLGSFHVENDNDEDDDSDEKNTVIVWKACGLQELFADKEGRQRILDEGNEKVGLMKWERIVPKVNTTFPVRPSSIDKESKEDNNRRAAAAPKNDLTSLVQELEPIMLSRGESQGGHYSSSHGTAAKDCFIIYGGMHRHRTSVLENGNNAPSTNNEVPLGDIWKYDYETETLSLLAPYPPLQWQRDDTSTRTYPTARTSHAGTVVGNKLIIHGGMGSYGDERNVETSNTHIVDYQTSSYSSSSYATYKTSPKWVPLSDTWEFDLITLKWKERVQYPQLARSYHSLVGWPDGRIAAFGGFQQDNNIGGETVAFVFKDVIVNRANETHWLKLLSPYSQIANWQKYHYKTRTGISNRLEHTAVLDQFGSMYVWGGRFQSVHQISGMWRLDVFNPDTRLEFELAQPDGIEQYEAELEALHMFIAMMMFASLMLSSFFSMLQQRRAREAAEEGNGGTMLPRRGGLTRRVIDSLPLKHYNASEAAESTSTDNTTLQEECCPICLVEYEQGCQIRSLPCGHEFCMDCIDPWLLDHTSCPACRQRVENIPLDQPSWATSIGRFYTPNRRNARYNFTQGPRQHFDQVVETESSDNNPPHSNSSAQFGDAAPSHPVGVGYDQGTPSRRSWFNIHHFFGRTAAHTVVPSDDTVGLQLV